jgi:CheY-like chemotaxis protein
MKYVLIADDEKSFLLSLQDGFKIHEDKFTIVTAGNGQEAVEVLKNNQVDLLVTDLEMPHMNGFELLAWASRELPQLPVIVMTAFGTPEIEPRLAQYETIHYLEKPLDLDTLEKAIFEGLGKDSKSYIQGITPASFLQLLQMEKKSCTLKVTSANKMGYLYMFEGNLIDAEYDELRGENAAHQIICWEKTKIELDNICRRQEGRINATIESILLNAHCIKDEGTQGGHALSSDPAGPSFALKHEKTSVTVNKGAWEELFQQIKAQQAVTECAIFDRHSVLNFHNPGECSLQNFDPAIFLHLSFILEEILKQGPCRLMCFSTTGRIPFLLFLINEYCLLVKLREGSRAQIISQELSQIIKSTTHTG